MRKGTPSDGTVEVTFTLDRSVGGERVAVCGDWNDWSAAEDEMVLGEHGWTTTIRLPVGTAYRFRYLIDHQRWENDWAADGYVPNAYGGDDSLLDLSRVDSKVDSKVDIAPAPAPAAKKTAAKKPAAKKTAVKEAAAPVKKAAAPAKKVAKKAVKKAP